MLEISQHPQPEGLSTATPGEWAGSWRWPICIGGREWTGVFQGHEIRVVTRGLLLARLHVDGQCLDKRSPLLSRTGEVPLLSAQLPGMRTGLFIVQVFSTGIWGRAIDVRVAGRQVEMKRTEFDKPVW